MTSKSEVERIWQAYLDSLPPGSEMPGGYETWSFGDSAEMADELGALVQTGIKTATCSLLWAYESEGTEKLPDVGDLSIITDGRGAPLCIIETIEVTIRPYDRVDAAFAYDEGEGDRSLAYWREGHWHFFSLECSTIGREPAMTMPLVCERFRVIYPTGDS